MLNVCARAKGLSHGLLYKSKVKCKNQKILELEIMETTVWTFKLSVPFSEWAKIYDSDDVTQMHASVGIKTLFRGVSKDDASKVCAIQQAPIGVAQKVFDENKEMIRGAGHIIESTVITAYSEQ